MEKYILIAAAALYGLFGCGNFEGERQPSEEKGHGDNVLVEMSFMTAESRTRSVLLTDGVAENLVTDITVAAYNENILGTWHLGDASPAVLEVPKNVKTFYFTANMGDMSSCFPESEDAVCGLSYRVDDFAVLSAKGIPMCAKIDWDGNAAVSVMLERLFAKIRVSVRKNDTFVNPANGSNAFYLMNMYVRNANTLLLPFGASFAASVDDVAGESDYQGSFGTYPEQSGSDLFTAEFYVPENMMGTLLPGNDDPWEKTAGNLVFGGNDFSRRCTYMEIGAASAYPVKGLHGSVKYRFFIGRDNVSNFDVCRNSVYDITLVPDYDNMVRPSWKVDFQGNDLRNLAFTDAREVVGGIPTYYFFTGGKNRVYLAYHRMAGTGTNVSSQTEFYKVDWDYCGDVAGLVDKGVASSAEYSIGTSPGNSSLKRHIVEFDIPATAKTGTYSISAQTYDGRRKAVSNIVVSDYVEWPMSFKWDIIPSYVGQYGTLSVGDVPDEVLPVSYAKSEEKSNVSESGDVVRLVPLNDDGTEYKVIASRQGRSVITFVNKDGGQLSEVVVNVGRPRLVMNNSASVYRLDVAGNEAGVSYSITDENGNALPNLDDNAVMEYLTPVPDVPEPVSSYLSVDVKPAGKSLEVYVSHVEDSMIKYDGSSFPVDFNFRDCAGDAFPGFKVMLVFPVAEDRKTKLGRIDDYGLLTYRPLRKQFCTENGIAYNGDDVYCTNPENYEFDSRDVFIGSKISLSVLPVSSVSVEGITSQPYPGATRLYSTAYAFPGTWMRYTLADNRTRIRFWPVYYHKIQDMASGIYEYDRNLGSPEESFSMFTHSAGKKYVRFHYINRHSKEAIGIIQGYIEFYVYGQLAWKRTEGAFEFQKPNGGGASGSGYEINGYLQKYYPFRFASPDGTLPGKSTVPCGLYPLFAYYECIGDMRKDTYTEGAYYSLPVMNLQLRSKDNIFTEMGIGDYYSEFNRWVYYDMSLVFAVPYRSTDKFSDMMSPSAQMGADCTGMYDAVYSGLMSGTPEGAVRDGTDTGCARASSGVIAFKATDNNGKIVVSNIRKNRNGNTMRLSCETYIPNDGKYSRRGMNNMLYRIIGYPGLDYTFFPENGKSHSAAPEAYNNVLPSLFRYDNPGIMDRINSSGTGKYGDRDADGKSYYQIVSIQDR